MRTVVCIYCQTDPKPSSNNKNSCSNHKIRELFEHVLSLKMRIAVRSFFDDVTYLKMYVNVMLIFLQITSWFNGQHSRISIDFR